MTLIQVAQHADNLDRAAAFHTDLLGAEPTGRFDPPAGTDEWQAFIRNSEANLVGLVEQRQAAPA